MPEELPNDKRDTSAQPLGGGRVSHRLDASAGLGRIRAACLGPTGSEDRGHAVAMQLGHESRSSYENESTADCLAGAFAEQAGRDKSLEKGDIEEAFLGMSLAGDPTPEPTGNARYDAMVQAKLARQSHGTK